MLIVSESAKVSPNADIEDSIRGTGIVSESGVVIDSFVKLKPAGRREVVERLVDGGILITKQECSQSSAQSQPQAEEGNFALDCQQSKE